MKKLILFFALGILFFSCNKGPEPELEEKPFPIGTWRTTHHEFSRTIEDDWLGYLPEELIEEREIEVSVDTSEDDAYQLTFNEDGSGMRVGIRHDGIGRFFFAFTWQLSDGMILLSGTTVGYGGVFTTYDGIALENVSWEIEDFTNNRVVLSQTWHADIDGIQAAWTESEVYRDTFERIK